MLYRNMLQNTVRAWVVSEGDNFYSNYISCL